MPTGEHVFSNSRAELLMDLAAGIAQYTQKAGDFRHLPALLAAALDLQPISLALVDTAAEGAGGVLLSAYSGAEPPPTFEQFLLAIHQQTRPLSPRDGPILRPAIDMEPGDLDPLHGSAFPRASVFAHSLEDARYRLLLVIHHDDGDPPLSEGRAQILQLVTRQLGKYLAGLVFWMTRPEALGEPFDSLTQREWMVLHSLDSDAGEKQLAEHLGLSPHTLHSHIKSIYRKVGVQGRLALLRRAEDALRDLCLTQMNFHPAPAVSRINSHAVAVS